MNNCEECNASTPYVVCNNCAVRGKWRNDLETFAADILKVDLSPTQLALASVVASGCKGRVAVITSPRLGRTATLAIVRAFLESQQSIQCGGPVHFEGSDIPAPCARLAEHDGPCATNVFTLIGKL